jgi:peptide deformylase
MMGKEARRGSGMPILRQIAQLGQPVLRGETESIEDLTDAAVQALIDDMLVTVAEVNGVGIAAPQVFEPLRLFIVASRPSGRYPHAPAMEPTAMINPELLWSSEETEKGWEGCLSVPGIRGPVPRSTRIGVRYLTRDGALREEEMIGFLARIFQHEYDHITGLVFLDRVESNLELITEREYQRLMGGG